MGGAFFYYYPYDAKHLNDIVLHAYVKDCFFR